MDPEVQCIFKDNHPKNTRSSLLCIPCCRSVSIEHQGKLDSQRDCLGKSNISKLNAKRFQGRTDAQFVTLGSIVGRSQGHTNAQLVTLNSNVGRLQERTDAQFVKFDSNVGKERKIVDGKLN